MPDGEGLGTKANGYECVHTYMEIHVYSTLAKRNLINPCKIHNTHAYKQNTEYPALRTGGCLYCDARTAQGLVCTHANSSVEA